jgi:Arc/MetJ-type ribon-helix-helix transcriptional regulator
MNDSLSQRIHDLAEEHVDGQNFASPDEVVVAALTLFNQFQTHQKLRDRLQVASEQLDRGEGLDVDSSGLRKFFDSVKADGRAAIQ